MARKDEGGVETDVGLLYLPMTSLDTLLHRMRACIVWRGAASLWG
jgi:hypothetical protein